MDDFSKKLKSKFKALLENKGRLFGSVYPYIFMVVLALGLLYVNNLDDIARRKILPAVPDTASVSDLKVTEAKTIPPIDINKLAEPSQELVNKGESLYVTMCASCHGENGNGEGPAAGGLVPQPRNFRGSEDWKNGNTIAGIYKTLEEGIPGSSMTSYEYLSPEEKINVAHYVRQSFMNNPPEDSKEDIMNLDLTYNISQGREVSAQIPVSAAINIILEENKTKVKEILSALESMSETREEPGYRIFTDIAINKVQAAAVLRTSDQWKGSRENFINIVLGHVNPVTFNRNANSLSSGEWEQLYNYMSRYF